MRIFTIYILTIAILLQSLNYAFIFFSFTINRDYIAEVLCINREKPEMNCKGHCQLSKKIQETEKQENKVPVKPDEKSFSFYFQPRQIVNLTVSLLYIDKEKYQIFESKPRLFIPDIFHPPKSNH